jgi:hypothetical protein
MSCLFDEKLLYLYIDNELEEVTSARITNHLSTCDHCRMKIDQLMLSKNSITDCCAETKTPDKLRKLITDSLHSSDSSNEIKTSYLNKIKVNLRNYYFAKTAAVAMAAAIFLIIILIPSGNNLNSIASTLTDEHINALDPKSNQEFSSKIPTEIETYFSDVFKTNIVAPIRLSGDLKLKCGSLVSIKSKPAAHLYYTNQTISFSLFIMLPKAIDGNDNTNAFKAMGQKYEFDCCEDVNLISWDKNKLIYILVGCCPLRNLVNLASVSI